MRRSAPFLLSALLAACSVQDAPKVPLVSHVVRHAAGGPCRVGADGGPLIADRGIGGTGAPVTSIGVRQADRGIGGTGIVGIVTGFASVCVDGLEVEYDSAAAVDDDGAPARAADLRVGQVVAIRAAGPASRLMAAAISVRRELVGRIEGVAADTGLVTIAGQTVAVRRNTEGADRFGAGDWVSVSGIWRGDGVLSATRIEAAPSGRLLAHGQVSLEGGVAKVGTLVLPADQAAVVMPGQRVTVTGGYRGKTPRVSAVARDMLLSDPAGFFGGSARHLVLQGFVQVAGGTLRLPGLEASAAPALRTLVRRDELAVVVLERRPDDGFVATGLRYAEPKPAASRRGRAAGNLAVGVSPVPASGGVTTNESEPQPAAAPEIEPDLLTSLLDTPVWPPVTVSPRPHPAPPPVPGLIPAPASGAGSDEPGDPATPPASGLDPNLPISRAAPPAFDPESGPQPDRQRGDSFALIGSVGESPAGTPQPAPRHRYAVASARHVPGPVGPASISLVAQTVRPEKRLTRHGTARGAASARPAPETPGANAID